MPGLGENKESECGEYVQRRKKNKFVGGRGRGDGRKSVKDIPSPLIHISTGVV